MTFTWLSTACTGSSSTPEQAKAFVQSAAIEPWLMKVDAHNQTYNFYLQLPEDYDATGTRTYPLLIFLHGDGGDRTYRPHLTPDLLNQGPLKPLYKSDTQLDPAARGRLNAHVRNAFVVYPKIPLVDETFNNPLGYWNGPTLDRVIDYLWDTYRIEKKRLYVTGMSMGGGGAFNYARTSPGRAAAIVPICNGLFGGWGAEQLAGLPVWLFHAFNDTLVPYRTQINPTLHSLMAGVTDVMEGYPHREENYLLPAAGDYTVSYHPQTGLGPWQAGIVHPSGLISYTLYESGGHDSWTRTYESDVMWNWLFSQRKPG